MRIRFSTPFPQSALLSFVSLHRTNAASQEPSRASQLASEVPEFAGRYKALQQVTQPRRPVCRQLSHLTGLVEEKMRGRSRTWEAGGPQNSICHRTEGHLCRDGWKGVCMASGGRPSPPTHVKPRVWAAGNQTALPSSVCGLSVHLTGLLQAQPAFGTAAPLSDTMCPEAGGRPLR